MKSVFKTNYDKICQYINNNDFNNAFDQTVIILKLFTDKYNDLNYSICDFRSDCKYTFTIIQKVFEMNGDVLSDMYYDIEYEQDKEMKYLLIQEKNEYLTFVNALKYIIDNIDDIDINSSELHEECSIIINYMHEREKSVDELGDTLNELGNKLKNVENVLQQLNCSTQK